MLVEERELCILKGVISDLPPEDQNEIKALADRLRAILQESEKAMVAYAMVALEIAIKQAGGKVK